MIHTAKGRHGNEQKSLRLHLGEWAVGSVCFQSQMRVCRVGTLSMLECLGLLVLDTWNVKRHLSLLIHLRSSEESENIVDLPIVKRG
jgi:hypothetical protein